MTNAVKEYKPLVLRPTAEEVLSTSWQDYIAKHEHKILKLGRGVCKIVMPASLHPRRGGYKHINMQIQKAIKQHAVYCSRGLYRMVYVEQKPMSLEEFRDIAMQKDNIPNAGERSGNELDDESLERKFWKNVTIRAPLYGADVPGSLFDSNAKGWNLRRLDTLLSTVLEEAGHKLPGINTPYLYFGQWRSVFAWHTEDLDLYSVNYLHFGAPKQWYVIPPEHSARFEAVAKAQMPEMHKHCSEFLRHKELLMSPQFLEHYQIPYVKVVQRPREFVITYPGAYHAGFNQGFNCAESVNFATKRWIPIGARAGVCECQSDAVQIDMRLFRHLVPSKDLPEDLLVDTSDEESEQEDSQAESDEESDEGSDDSTTENLAAGLKRRGSTVAARSDKSSASTPSKRARATQPANLVSPSKQQGSQQAAAHASPMALRSRGAGGQQSPVTQSNGNTPQLSQHTLRQRMESGAMLTRRAAAASGRLSVRERIAMRGVSIPNHTRHTPHRHSGSGAGTPVATPAPTSQPTHTEPAPDQVQAVEQTGVEQVTEQAMHVADLHHGQDQGPSSMPQVPATSHEQGPVQQQEQPEIHVHSDDSGMTNAQLHDQHANDLTSPTLNVHNPDQHVHGPECMQQEIAPIPGSPSPPQSPRPRRANAGQHRWMNTDMELDADQHDTQRTRVSHGTRSAVAAEGMQTRSRTRTATRPQRGHATRSRAENMANGKTSSSNLKRSARLLHSSRKRKVKMSWRMLDA